jgi:hypothetical protein
VGSCSGSDGPVVERLCGEARRTSCCWSLVSGVLMQEGSMTVYLADWQERDLDRQSARQRNQVETAKLLATFSVSAVAAIVAAALQVALSRVWDVLCPCPSNGGNINGAMLRRSNFPTTNLDTSHPRRQHQGMGPAVSRVALPRPTPHPQDLADRGRGPRSSPVQTTWPPTRRGAWHLLARHPAHDRHTAYRIAAALGAHREHRDGRPLPNHKCGQDQLLPMCSHHTRTTRR